MQRATGFCLALAAGVAFGCSAGPRTVSAASIAVSPISLEIVAEADAASNLTVTNMGAEPANVQVRALRWTQANGTDQLEASDDVAVSPPIVQILPGVQQVIRVVRLSRRPVVGEEAYRLLVDEIPSAGGAVSTNVNLVVRQSIPVFFRSPSARSAPLSFKVTRQAGGLFAVADNGSEIHQKLTMLTIKDHRGAVEYARSGLVGYVLGRSSFAWQIPASAGEPAMIEGRTDQGPIKLNIAAHP
jgi:fimbrial chaperone protein